VLEELHVRDLALVEDAWLEFGPGMTVLTGETGAGKTALISAMKLLLGERADSGSVRAGASESLVEGRFVICGDEVLVRRRAGIDGRSRCTIDSEMATVKALAERIGPTVDLLGQHEHQALLHIANHSGYLDGYAGEDAAAALASYRDALRAFESARVERERLEQRLRDARAHSEQLRFVADDIARVDPVLGEDEEIEARLPALQHAEKLAGAAGEAARAARGEGGATDGLAVAAAALGKVEGIDPALDALGERVREALALSDDVGSELRSYRDAVQHDPADLDVLQARMGELHGLMRKYGPTLADVIRTREEADGALGEAGASEELLDRASGEVALAQSALHQAAGELQAIRESAAPRFVAELTKAVAELAMGGSSFEVALEPLEFEQWTNSGPSRVEFLYSPATGHPARPLARIASGGEISRVMLALKGVLGAADTVETLVFDEVDAGVGGATAHDVGRRLAELARAHQVIVVTHLAQVATHADTHLVVRKSETGEQRGTTVERVEGEERVLEVARMLSGNDSDASVAHAKELLRSTEGASQAISP
jgi:DNA repair protein RecN (Recombination protein N)